MTHQSVLNDPEFRTPGDSKGLLSVFQHRYLLSLLVKKGVTTRYYGSALGWIWSYIRPLAQLFMYGVVIGILLGVARGAGMKFFPIYLFSGIIMVNLFSESFRSTTSAIVSNKALIRKIYLPREMFTVSAAIGSVIHFLPQAAILLAVCIIFGWTVTWAQLGAFVVAVLIVTLFALGLGLFFGGLNVAYRDSKNIVDIILMFSTWSSPVLYPFTLVKEQAANHDLEWLYHVYMCNPVTVGVELTHNAFWLPLNPEYPRPEFLTTYTFVALGIVAVTLIVGQLVFRKMEGRFAQSL